MARPILMLTERRAAQQAIIDLEAGRTEAAAAVLKQALSRRTPPPPGRPDTRSLGIVHLRAQIEKAIVEIEHERGSVIDALRTLRVGLGEPV